MLLTTDRLLLVSASLPMLDAIADSDWPTLSRLLGGVDLADHWLHFPEAMIWMRDYLQEHPGEADWWSYLVVHRKDARLIGTCGYKGMPGPDGTVEIGYEIADGYQGQGFATELAGSLVRNAFEYESVLAVLAHTLAEKNASVSVLRKLGFAFKAELFDLEDGKIWQWRLGRK